jgi:hypothetical protein
MRALSGRSMSLDSANRDIFFEIFPMNVDGV